MEGAMRPGKPWLFIFSLATVVCTFVLLGIGGLVTSHGAGMAVPDWPTTYGYNMFFFPFSYWVGGIFYEHSHRLIASFVGLLTVLLTRWLGGHQSRKALGIIGVLELVAGIGLAVLKPELKGTGYFLSGIGGVVIMAALIPFRNEPAARPLPLFGWIAFWSVQVQGLLGGLRVVLFKDEIGIFHATLAQLFFVLICIIVLMTHRSWGAWLAKVPSDRFLARWSVVATSLVLLQLIFGAAMRHEHAGLAIPDFPLAYGKLWPDTSPEAIQRYNSRRVEIHAAKDITASQVHLQMVHRITAVLIFAVISTVAFQAVRRHGLSNLMSRLSLGWLALVLVQVGLGAFTIWSDKAADVATAHLLCGALTLALGVIVCILLFVALAGLRQELPIYGIPQARNWENPPSRGADFQGRLII